ncbi:hypothetical protein RsoM2USA_39 [Ralstonia phage RsoM2USA]|nr:hypothetical protein RsoM2USA_39 [Ralstonia phage RsoM2USA]
MKIEEELSEVELSEEFEESAFRIDASAKMFEILFDKIYSDKIASVVREIGSNALDSHTKAGCKNLPFEIHVPTQMEPWFSVKDFGVGLNTQEVKEIYTVMTKSTKTNNNDEIGGFGLGSKTPFAYTDSFTVICVKDGIKVEYAMYRNAQGIPAFTSITSSTTPSGDVIVGEETNEPNGVEVKIPVKIQDISYFGQCIQKTYCSFEVIPQIVNPRPQFRIDRMTSESFSKQARTYRYAFENGSNYFSGLLVKLGPIIYPVDLDKVFAHEYSRSANKFSLLSREKLMLEFAIGELAITVSREQLAYDKPTCKAIIDRLEHIYNESIAEIESKIATCTNRIQAKRMFASMRKGDPSFLPLTNTILAQGWHVPTWKGEQLSNQYETISIDDPTQTIFRIQQVDSRTLKDSLLENRSWDYDNKGNRVPVYTYQYNLDVVNGTFFYEDQDRLTPANRASFFAENRSKDGAANHGIYSSRHANPIYVIRPKEDVKLSGNKFEKALKEFQRLLNVECRKLSELPKRESPKVVKSKDLELSVFDYEFKKQPPRGWYGRPSRHTETLYSAMSWPKEKVTLDPKQTYYYVRVVGFDVIENDDYEHGKVKQKLAEMVKISIQLGLLPNGVKIRAIRKSDVDVMQTGKWVEVLSYLKDQVSKLVSKNKEEISMVDIVTWMDENLSKHNTTSIFMQIAKSLYKDDLSGTILENSKTNFAQVMRDAVLVNKAITDTKKKETLRLIRNLGILLDPKFDPKNDSDKEIRERIEVSLARYPLMRFVSNCYVKSEAQALVDYAVAIDKHLGESYD